jgi:hypothetical protein
LKAQKTHKNPALFARPTPRRRVQQKAGQVGKNTRLPILSLIWYAVPIAAFVRAMPGKGGHKTPAFPSSAHFHIALLGDPSKSPPEYPPSGFSFLFFCSSWGGVARGFSRCFLQQKRYKTCKAFFLLSPSVLVQYKLS